MERDERKAIKKTTRKRKEPLVGAESQSEARSCSVNTEDVRDISDDDVEDYMARNRKLWNYVLDENNFKYSNSL